MRIFLLLLLAACTRDNAKSSAVNIDIASISGHALAAGNPLSVQHIVINVRNSAGALMLAPITWDADCHCSTQTNLVAPTSFSMTVPNATSGMLVQVAVAGNDGSGNFVIKYGDATVDMSGGQDKTVSISSQPFAQGNGAEGRLIGKFIEAAGAARSGRALMQIVPPNGKPTVDIDRVDVIGGIFSLTVMDNIPFRYVFEDGTVMFNSVMLNNSQLVINGVTQSPGAHLVGVDIPSYYEYQGQDANNQPNCPQKNAHVNYYGFFGDPTAISSTAVVYGSGGSTLQSNYITLAACQAQSVNTADMLTFYPSGAATASTVGRVGGAGGVATNGGTDFINQFTIDGTQTTKETEAVGIYGAFQVVSGTQSGLSVVTSSHVMVSWTYLDPLVTGGLYGATGTDVYYRQYGVGDTSFYNLNDINCDALASMGFTLGATATGATSSVILTSLTSSTNVGFIACTYQTNIFGFAKRYFTSTARYF